MWIRRSLFFVFFLLSLTTTMAADNCDSISLGHKLSPDRSRNLEVYEEMCACKNRQACIEAAAFLFRAGLVDESLARLKTACSLDSTLSCTLAKKSPTEIKTSDFPVCPDNEFPNCPAGFNPFPAKASPAKPKTRKTLAELKDLCIKKDKEACMGAFVIAVTRDKAELAEVLKIYCELPEQFACDLAKGKKLTISPAPSSPATSEKIYLDKLRTACAKNEKDTCFLYDTAVAEKTRSQRDEAERLKLGMQQQACVSGALSACQQYIEGTSKKNLIWDEKTFEFACQSKVPNACLQLGLNLYRKLGQEKRGHDLLKAACAEKSQRACDALDPLSANLREQCTDGSQSACRLHEEVKASINSNSNIATTATPPSPNAEKLSKPKVQIIDPTNVGP